jgi:hypothetical protein
MLGLMSSATSAPDPFRLREWADVPEGGIQSRDGRTQRSPRRDPGETTFVIIVAGQSLTCNYVNAFYTPTHGSKIDILDIYNGGIYAAAEPFLGCDGPNGNAYFAVADEFISYGLCDRMILVPIGIRGATVEQYSTGALNDRLIVAPRRCAALGLSVSAFFWAQGETDNYHGISQSAYAAGLAQVIATPRAAGFDAPWLLSKSTVWWGEPSAAIRAAIDETVNGTDIFAGADSDAIGMDGRYDTTHLNAAGSAQLGVRYRNAWIAAF